MPSPIGHALAGLSVHALTARDEAERREPLRLALIVGAALAPDLDLLLNLMDGRNHHQGPSHSIGAAVLAALAVTTFGVLAGRREAWRLGAWAGVGWLSHLALDFLSIDTSPPIGLPLLWPVATGYYKSPWPLFLDIGRTLNLATVVHNAMAVAWEIVVLGPLAWWSWRSWRGGSRRPH
jgi:hypothetical protein